MSPEQFPRPSREPLYPIDLPPELAEFLREQPAYCCLPHASDAGTLYIVKAPGIALAQMPFQVPVRINYELFALPTAPVIRTVIRVYDQPHTPMAFETFANVGDPQQRKDFAALAQQRELHFAFYDEALQHRRTKVVANLHRRAVETILTRASDLHMAIPAEAYDFDTAKALVMNHTHL